MSTEAAHGKATETGSVVLSLDGRTLLTRGGDDTVKSAYQYLHRAFYTADLLFFSAYQHGTFVPSKNHSIPSAV